jgi:hypothetical protein
VAVASFAIVNGAIAVTCTACEAISTVTARPVRAKTEPTPNCPKCGTARADEPACPSCGLLAANMKAFAANRDAGVPDAVRAAWTAASVAWDQKESHDALLQTVAQHSTYAWAAARYREIQRARPGDSIAPKRLDRLRRAAEATMFAGASVRADKTPKPYRSAVMVLALLLAILAAGLVYTFVAQNSPPPPAPHPSTSVETR